MQNLIQGQNTKLPGLVMTAQFASGFAPEITKSALDINAFMLGANGKVAGDAEFVFYNQPTHPSGALRIHCDSLRYELDLAQTPPTIEKIVLAITIDPDRAGTAVTFKSADYIALSVRGGGADILFRMESAGMTETSLILGEFYKRNGEWKFKAIGQGFAGGLEPLATHYGVSVDQPAAAEPSPPTPKPEPASFEPQPSESSRVSLSKITVTKRQSFWVEKKSTGFGQIVLNLNWTQNPPGAKKGLLSGLLARNQGIDLDLGAMVEYQNSDKTVIQALGNGFGAYGQRPWVHLMGDDRTGSSTAGEFIKINGQYWEHFRRVLVFAFIYEGVPNWSQARAKVSIKMPDQPELEVRLDSHDNKKTMCAVAMIENEGGSMRVSKLVDYFSGHVQMDRAFGFGFRWEEGRK